MAFLGDRSLAPYGLRLVGITPGEVSAAVREIYHR
jgi:hypothetical protein